MLSFAKQGLHEDQYTSPIHTSHHKIGAQTIVVGDQTKVTSVESVSRLLKLLLAENSRVNCLALPKLTNWSCPEHLYCLRHLDYHIKIINLAYFLIPVLLIERWNDVVAFLPTARESSNAVPSAQFCYRHDGGNNHGMVSREFLFLHNRGTKSVNCAKALAPIPALVI